MKVLLDLNVEIAGSAQGAIPVPDAIEAA